MKEATRTEVNGNVTDRINYTDDWTHLVWDSVGTRDRTVLYFTDLESATEAYAERRETPNPKPKLKRHLSVRRRATEADLGRPFIHLGSSFILDSTITHPER